MKIFFMFGKHFLDSDDVWSEYVMNNGFVFKFKKKRTILNASFKSKL